jgi:membrane associated rhomboid family serine protease
MLPYHDENETQRTPYVTVALIAVNAIAWIIVQGAGAALPLATSVCNLGLIPAELTLAVPPGAQFSMGENIVCLTDPGRGVSHVLTSMFLHGSWMHLLGNMWFLWLFGNNIEDSMTHGRFVAFYLLSGIAAALLQVVAEPASTVPMVGASGAISGVMGAYLVLYPRVRVYTLLPLGFFFTTIAVPAWAMLLYWAFIQLVSGVGSIGADSGTGGVAFWAHLGGFVAGIVLVKIFQRADHVEQHESRHWRPRRVGY